MILHVFNPEHDLALASNLSNFTAPHAGRKLRADLGCLPALWAGDDCCVLADHVGLARKTYSRLKARVGGGQVMFVDKTQLSQLPITKVEPWGWDLALRSFLLRHGVDAVPSEKEIADIRELSHRRYAVRLLDDLARNPALSLEQIRIPSVCGSLEEVKARLEEWRRIVVKAPWSSSGRGVRFLDNVLNDYHAGWISNVLRQQGAVVAEPYYNKVKDFGMEFMSDGRGGVSYLGLSLFQTRNGAYTGNIIATEEEKEEMISRYVPADILRVVRESICERLGPALKDKYCGPLGVDMMVIATGNSDGFLLHPCVEINLRRTMGHVALSIHPFADGFPRVMQIVLTDRYRIQIRKQ